MMNDRDTKAAASGAAAGAAVSRLRSLSNNYDTIKTDARQVSARGWAIFPVGPDKKPLCKWRDVSAPDPSLIQNGANMGVDCGKSGLVVLDLDVKDGRDGLAAWETLKAKLEIDESGALITETPSGGRHLIWKDPTGGLIGNSSRNLPEGIDVRGNGGYIVAPPSVTPAGRYRWIRDRDPEPLPPELVRLLLSKPEPEPQPIPKRDPGDRSAYALAALEAEAELLASTAPGGRNEQLNRSAYALGQLVGAGALSRSEVEVALYNAVVGNGLVSDDGENSVRKTLRSGLDAGERDPRRIPEPEAHQQGAAEPGTARNSDVEADPEAQDGWKVYTVADAYAPRPPITYLVEGLLPLPSLTIVYAPPGDFKTMLMADLAACVAAGEPWLPPLPGKVGNVQRKTTRAGVLWADFDNGPRTMHERIEAVCRARDLPEDAPLYYVSMPSPWLDASNLDSIVDLFEIIMTLGVELVIIDNLRDVSGKVDENSAEMGNVMSHFRRLAEDCEVALVIVHHQRKGNGYTGRAGDALRGHSSIEAALDLALAIEREEHADSVKIKATKVRGADVYPFGAIFTYEHKPGTTELAKVRFYGQEVEDLTSDKAIRRAILEEVRTDPGVNKGDLTDAVKERLGGQPGILRIGQQIDYLTGEGKLALEIGAYNAHCYSIPSEGEHVL